MRTLSLAALALLLLPAMALAAPPSQDQLKKQRDDKLAEAWVTKYPWVTDYAKARAQSRKDQKLIFAYFSRSYSP